MNKNFLIGVVAFAAGTLFGAMNYTLIVGDDGFGFMKKAELTLSNSYYDTRGWGAIDYLRHPDVAAWKAGRTFKKLTSAARELKNDIKEGAKQVIEDVKEGAVNAKEGIKEGAKDFGHAAKEEYQKAKENVSDAVNGDDGDQPVTGEDQPVE